MPITRAIEEKFRVLFANLGKTKEEMKADSVTNLEKMREYSAANLAKMKEEMRKDTVVHLGEMEEEVKNMIDDKLTFVEDRKNSIDKKFDETFEAMEERLEKVEKQIEDIVAKAVEKRMERVKIDIYCLKKKKVITENYTEESKFQPSPLQPSTKLFTFDSKKSWKIYETQFAIVMDAKGWDSNTKASHLAASLRAHADDVLQTLPKNKQLDF